jgi:hypothetical protein
MFYLGVMLLYEVAEELVAHEEVLLQSSARVDKRELLKETATRPERCGEQDRLR